MASSYEQLFQNNQKWVEEKLAKDAHFFEQLSKDQNPEYLYIGCSDSRVTAEEIMGLGPGDVFVHRNVANLINSTDLSAITAIEYAVKYLKVKHVIVCGHYNCGGIKAAMEPKDLGILNPWLRTVRDVYRMHKSELNAITDQQSRYNRLVELNVVDQCINVIKMATVQLSYKSNGYPKVHGWVFDIHKGKIIDLEINTVEILSEISEIYDLTK